MTDLSTAPVRDGAIKLHGPDGFAGMRKAGRLAAECLDMLTPHVQAGVTTEHLDDLARTFGEAPTLTAARLIVSGALARRESRGAHFRTDHPAPATTAKHTRTRSGSVDRVEACPSAAPATDLPPGESPPCSACLTS